MTGYTIEQLIVAREKAMAKVRAWWDAELLAGSHRYVTDAPAWKEYLAACAACEEEWAAIQRKET